MTWQEEAVEKVAQKRKTLYGSTFKGLNRAHLHMPLSMVELIEQACIKRNVNRSTYMRRAIALLLAKDLNLPIRHVLRHSPSPGPHGGLQFNRGQADDGTGIESWCPHPGCDGSHLS